MKPKYATCEQHGLCICATMYLVSYNTQIVGGRDGDNAYSNIKGTVQPVCPCSLMKDKNKIDRKRELVLQANFVFTVAKLF